MKRTIRDRLVAALEAHGWVRDLGHPTRKFCAYRPKDYNAALLTGWTIVNVSCYQNTVRMFVGKAGSLRRCPNGNVTSSIPIHKAKARLLAEQP